MGRFGTQNLVTMPGRHQPRGSVHRGAEVVTVAFDRLTCMESNSDRQADRRGPHFARQSALEIDRRPQRVAGASEGGGEAIATGRKHHSAVLGNSGLDDGVMSEERLCHRIGLLLPQSCGPFDVGENKRDRPRRPFVVQHRPSVAELRLRMTPVSDCQTLARLRP